jgi:hypothetical protein
LVAHSKLRRGFAGKAQQAHKEQGKAQSKAKAEIQSHPPMIGRLPSHAMQFLGNPAANPCRYRSVGLCFATIW